MTYYPLIMTHQDDVAMIEKFIAACSRRGMTLEQMGASVERTKSWASRLVNGQIDRLQFRTRNSIRAFLRGRD